MKHYLITAAVLYVAVPAHAKQRWLADYIAYEKALEAFVKN